MRKQYVLGMTLIASLAFASCSKDEQVVQEGNGIETVQDDGQVLTLQVSNSGDGLTTRAGRPLLSSQAKQDINTIDLFVVNSSNKVVLKKTIGASEWANALDYGTGNGVAGHGKQLQISFKGSEKQSLTAGNYTIYAVAYKNVANSAETNYKLTDTDLGLSSAAPTETNDKSNVTFTADNFSAILKSEAVADEIFAGTVAIKVVDADGDSYITTSAGSTKKDKPTLVLNRQVAGVTGYFTNLPAKVGEQIPTKIRLVASNKSNKVHFTSMVSGETDGTTTAAATSVVNGSASSLTAENLPYWNSSKKGYKVYEIDLASFFTQMSGEPAQTFDKLDLDKDGFVGYKDAQYYVYNYETNKTNNKIFTTEGKLTSEALAGWKNAIKGGSQTINGEEITCQAIGGFWKNANANQTLVAGSVFAGEFIIPFLQVSKTNTFELQLLDEHDNILKTWNVQVPTKVTGGNNGNIAAGITATWADDTDLIYNIYRNHLYSLGLKTADGDGGTKPDPDPDPNPEDKPEDLSKGQDLLINVNDNWEIIHNMVID